MSARLDVAFGFLASSLFCSIFSVVVDFSVCEITLLGVDVAIIFCSVFTSDFLLKIFHVFGFHQEAKVICGIINREIAKNVMNKIVLFFMLFNYISIIYLHKNSRNFYANFSFGNFDCLTIAKKVPI